MREPGRVIRGRAYKRRQTEPARSNATTDYPGRIKFYDDHVALLIQGGHVKGVPTGHDPEVGPGRVFSSLAAFCLVVTGGDPK